MLLYQHVYIESFILYVLLKVHSPLNSEIFAFVIFA